MVFDYERQLEIKKQIRSLRATIRGRNKKMQTEEIRKWGSRLSISTDLLKVLILIGCLRLENLEKVQSAMEIVEEIGNCMHWGFKDLYTNECPVDISRDIPF